MGFDWDAASLAFLAFGLALVVVAVVLLFTTAKAAIYPLVVGATALLAGAAMAYQR
jgi:uncharacterized membrane protein HdeD (DUF308 family)